TEGLAFNGSESSLIHVGTRNVPARRETGLVEDHGPLRFGDDLVTMTDDEMTGGPADVDAMVAVGGMPSDPFILFVEGVHGGPCECNPHLQLARIRRQVDVSPRSSVRVLLAGPDGIPRRESQVGMLARVMGVLQGVCRNVTLWKICHRITPW